MQIPKNNNDVSDEAAAGWMCIWGKQEEESDVYQNPASHFKVQNISLFIFIFPTSFITKFT